MNNLFNEAYYLAYNRDVAAAVARGEMTAEQHFELFGNAEGRAPGPMFDSEYYLAGNPDVREAVEAGLTTAYDHFLRYGAGENRSPLIVFDPEYYLARNDDVSAAVDDGVNAVQHFLLYGNAEPRPISPFIDLAAYLRANPDVAEAVAAGQTSAFLHLLDHGVFEGRDLGNGIHLRLFQDDAEFVNALEVGNLDLALARMQDVAPFLPGFKPPKGWTPAADTPIPIDFVPPEGMKLVVPPSVKVPPELLPLPDTFEPIDNGGGGGSKPTFTVDFADGDGIYTFGGTARGDIKVSIDDDAIVSFTRQGVTANTTINLNAPDEWEADETFIYLKAGDTLALNQEQVQAFSLASECGCTQYEAFTGTGRIRLDLPIITEDTDLTLFSPALSVAFKGNTITVDAYATLLLHPQHADGLSIINAGGVVILPDDTATNGVTLDIESATEFGAINAIGATSGDDEITIDHGTLNLVYSGLGNDEITINGGGLNVIYAGSGEDEITINGTAADDADCECPEEFLNIVMAGDGNDTITLTGAGFSIIHAGTGGDEISMSENGLALMVVVAGRPGDGDDRVASDSYWSKAGGTWDVIQGFKVGDDPDDFYTFNGLLMLVEEDTYSAPVCDADDITVTLSDDLAITFSVKDGVATVADAGSLQLNDIVQAMAIHIDDTNAMVAFMHEQNSYLFVNDGQAALEDSDTFIELVNTSISNINQLLNPSLDDWPDDWDVWPDLGDWLGDLTPSFDLDILPWLVSPDLPG